jgi:hypothetical protein
LNYNDYYAPGSGGVLGYYNGTNKTTLPLIPGQDANSLNTNPGFVVAGSTIATDYIINVTLNGFTISSITTDFGGNGRGDPPSIGAWEKMLRKWKGTISNSFAVSGNWTDGIVPQSGENIMFDDNPDRDCYLDANRTIGNLTINQAIDKMVLNGFRLSVNGSLLLTNSGQIDARSSNSTIAFTGSNAQSINSGAFTDNSVYNFTLNNNSSVSLNGDLEVNSVLDLSNGTLNLSAITLGINGSIVRTNGSITAGANSTIRIGGSGTQFIIPGNSFTGNSVANFTIARPTGVALYSNLNVSGVLDLQTANPSATVGCLETGAFEVIMGASATTIGQGDVNGTVTRNSFTVNTPYTFGNQFTSLTFSPGGTLPAAMGVKIALGVAPTWKPDAIQRSYDISHTGGNNTGVTLNLHFLDSELNDNPEADLYAWNFHSTSPVTLEKHDRTAINTTTNWISSYITDIEYFATTFGESYWSLAKSYYATFMGVKGWRMITSPTLTTSADLLTGFISQGVPGSSYPEKQPNFLWFDETDTLTTNMSWRTSIFNNDIVRGRGYYFYVFDSLSGAYCDTLPRRMTSSGNTYFPGSFTYSGTNHPVTWTRRVGGQAHILPNDTTFYDTNIDDQGWNLMGNPTLSTLNWDASQGWSKTNLDNTIYIWDPAVNQFRVWNGINGTLANGLISPFQAFWIKANNPNPALSFTSDALTTGGTFYGGTSTKSQTVKTIPSAINLNLYSAGLESDILISFNENGKIGADAWDAYRLEPLSNSSLEFFTLSSPSFIMPLVINNLPSDSTEWINLPLFACGQLYGQQLGGIFTMNWELPPDWPADWAISLNDHSAKKAISMRKEHTYSFSIANIKSSGINTNLHDGVSVPVLPPSIINPVAIGSMLKGSTQLPPFSLVIEKGNSGDDPVYFAPEATLLQNYPNPFSLHTTIRFSLPVPAHVTLNMFDIYGKLVDVVTDREFETGIYNLPWHNNYLKPGFYLLQMDADGVIKTIKMVIIK